MKDSRIIASVFVLFLVFATTLLWIFVIIPSFHSFDPIKVYEKIPEQYKIPAMKSYQVIIASEDNIYRIWSRKTIEQEESGWFDDQALAGLTKRSGNDSKIIYISKETLNPDKVYYHELGHALDMELGYPSKNEDFLALYQKEAEGYAKLGSREYFAEAYKALITGSDKFLLAQSYIKALLADT